MLAECDEWAEDPSQDAQETIVRFPFAVFRVALPPSKQDLDLQSNLGRFFFYYFDYLSEKMIPSHAAFNPWRTLFAGGAFSGNSSSPGRATLEEQALQAAINAHAATHLSQKGSPDRDTLEVKAAKFYMTATRKLQQSIESAQRDHGTFLAAILTLMMVEVSLSSVHANKLRLTVW